MTETYDLLWVSAKELCVGDTIINLNDGKFFVVSLVMNGPEITVEANSMFEGYRTETFKLPEDNIVRVMREGLGSNPRSKVINSLSSVDVLY